MDPNLRTLLLILGGLAFMSLPICALLFLFRHSSRKYGGKKPHE